MGAGEGQPSFQLFRSRHNACRCHACSHVNVLRAPGLKRGRNHKRALLFIISHIAFRACRATLLTIIVPLFAIHVRRSTFRKESLNATKERAVRYRLEVDVSSGEPQPKRLLTCPGQRSKSTAPFRRVNHSAAPEQATASTELSHDGSRTDVHQRISRKKKYFHRLLHTSASRVRGHLFRVKLLGRHGELLQRRRRLVQEELAQPSGRARKAGEPSGGQRDSRNLGFEPGGIVEHEVLGVAEPCCFGLGVYL